jgi:hypothetical protein
MLRCSECNYEWRHDSNMGNRHFQGDEVFDQVDTSIEDNEPQGNRMNDEGRGSKL